MLRMTAAVMTGARYLERVRRLLCLARKLCYYCCIDTTQSFDNVYTLSKYLIGLAWYSRG